MVGIEPDGPVSPPRLRTTRDTDDFDAFCSEVHSRLVGALGLFCNDRDLARDLAQESLARACRDWAKVRQKDSPEAWVIATGLNLAKSWFRRRGVASRKAHLTVVQPSGADMDEALTLRAALQRLSRREREAVILRYFNDLSIAQTAVVMNCAEGTVRALTAKGVATLRVVLNEEWLDDV